MNRRALLLLLLVPALLAGAGCTTKPAADQISSDGPAAVRATASTTAMAPEPSAKPAGGRLESVEAASDTDALSLVRTKRLEAKAAGRVLVVYVSATWCEPCKRLKSEIAAGRLDARLGKTTLLAFDADRDGDRLAAAGYAFTFVPFVALPGPDGRPAESQQATGKGGEAWRELLAKLDAWQAAVP